MTDEAPAPDPAPAPTPEPARTENTIVQCAKPSCSHTFAVATVGDPAYCHDHDALNP